MHPQNRRESSRKSFASVRSIFSIFQSLETNGSRSGTPGRTDESMRKVWLGLVAAFVLLCAPRLASGEAPSKEKMTLEQAKKEIAKASKEASKDAKKKPGAKEKKEEVKTPPPGEAIWTDLIEGNARFVTGKPRPRTMPKEKKSFSERKAA